MSTSRYKGLNILTQPYQLHETRRWTADLEIRRRGRSQPITLDERYSSAQEAEAHCSSVARLIIDGGLPKWSVNGLRGGSRHPWSFTHLWEAVLMRPYPIAGIVLIVLGAFVLLRDASFTSRENVVSLGDLQITAEERQTIPPWVGAGALVAGVALIVVGMKKRT